MRADLKKIRGSPWVTCSHCGQRRKALVRVHIDGIISTGMCHACLKTLRSLLAQAVNLSAVPQGVTPHIKREAKP